MAAPEVARYFMNDMQKLGLCFALDNFGAGQTSLVQLRNFLFRHNQNGRAIHQRLGTIH